MYKRSFFTVLVALMFLLSCESNVAYTDFESFPEGWEKENPAVFNIPNLDSTRTYNLFINLRNNNDYAYSNLFLISEIEFPHGKIVTDTLEYEMAKPDGTWLGTGFGDVKENKLWFKENIRFTEEGSYKISLQQAMRKNGEDKGIQNLEGITEVGISVEEVQSTSSGEN